MLSNIFVLLRAAAQLVNRSEIEWLFALACFFTWYAELKLLLQPYRIVQTIVQQGGDVADLCLTFSATTEVYGATKVTQRAG